MKECAGKYTTHFNTYKLDAKHIKCNTCGKIWTNKQFEKWGSE